MGKPLPAPVRDDTAERERLFASRAERRARLLAEGDRPSGRYQRADDLTPSEARR
jgi:hypothetical protein